ncbi:MAG TPA: hypothetical protein VEW25_06910 [Allosphingosinicella sp.]|nr:hypothetical protein [Allosphingosinicella sp.]
MKTLTKLAAGLTFFVLAATTPAQAQPNPILYLTGLEYYTTPAGSFVRYRYDVFNKAEYPVAMFAPAPGLPPCGLNANSSRTWVDFFNGRTNQRIYGFCALTNPSQLGSIWFAMPEGTIPPSYVYIVIRDRQTNTNYRSNLADTTL